MQALRLLLLAAFAAHAGAGQIPQALRPQARAKADLFDLEFVIDPAKASLDRGFWVGVGMDPKGNGSAIHFRRSEVALFARRAGREQELARAGIDAGTWAGPGCTVTVALRPRRVAVSIHGRRIAVGRVDALPGDHVAVHGLPPSALVRRPQVHKRGRPYFNEDFSSHDVIPDTWRTEMGQWQLEAPVDPLIARNENTPMYSLWVAKADQSVVTAGHRFWDFYTAEVTCHLRSGRGAGLVLYWQDKANHAALVLHRSDHGAQPRLHWVRNGERHHVDGPESVEPDQWHRLRVEAVDDRVWAYVDGRPVAAAVAVPLRQGKVGLCALGSGAAFDDVSVEPADALTLAPSGPTALPTAWDGVRLHGPVAAKSAAALWIEDSRADARAECARDPKTGQWRLWVTDQGKRHLAGAVTTAAAPGTIELTSHDGRVAAVWDGQPVGRWRFPAFEPSRAGCRGKGSAPWAAAFTPKPALVYENDFSSATVQSKAVRRLFGTLGADLVGDTWRWAILPSVGHLSARAKNHSSLWFSRPCPGDVKVSAQVAALGQGVGLRIAADRTRPKTGYSAMLNSTDAGLRLSLRRGDRVVAEKAIPRPKGSAGLGLSIERDGPFVVAGVERAAPLAWIDPEPLDGEWVGLTSEGEASVDALRIENLTALRYSFERLSASWRQQSGGWMLHSGLSCIPWNYWLTADGRREPAVLWHRAKLPDDVAVRFDVSEITIGTDDPDVTHYHYPYHDITLALCADGRDLRSGYAVEIGANRGTCTRMRRRGKVVFETYGFDIVMGDHCNTPRQVEVYLRKAGSRLTLVLNGQTLVQFEDPDPLPAGWLGLGVSDCRANFSDVFIMPESVPWSRVRNRGGGQP